MNRLNSVIFKSIYKFINYNYSFLFLTLMDRMLLFEADYVGISIEFLRKNNLFTLKYSLNLDCREFLLGKLFDE